MGTRTFKVDFMGYGGEFVAGVVSEEFVEYWKEKDGYDLFEHLLGIEYEDPSQIDHDSPRIFSPEQETEFYAWHAVDDLEHMSTIGVESNFYVTEMEGDDEISDTQSYPIYNYVVASREGMYTYHGDDEDVVPVMMVMSVEKGHFFSVIVETENDEPFNPELLQVATIETDFGDFVERVYYGTQELELETEWYSTTGKATECAVGYFVPDWRDEIYDEHYLLEELKANVANVSQQ